MRRYAQWWNAPTYAIAELDRLLPLAGSARVSTQHLVTLGRDSAHVAELVGPARRRFAGWGGEIEGTSERVAQGFIDEARKGVEHFYVMFTDFAAGETLERFAREVIPAVRDALR